MEVNIYQTNTFHFDYRAYGFIFPQFNLYSSHLDLKSAAAAAQKNRYGEVCAAIFLETQRIKNLTKISIKMEIQLIFFSFLHFSSYFHRIKKFR